MLDILSLIGTINRPKLLVRTARFAVDDYRRNHHLPRLLKTMTPPRSGEALLRLMDLEADIEAMRQTDRADYSFARHVDVLIAIMGESRLYRAATGAA